MDDYLGDKGSSESTIHNLRAGPVEVAIGDGQVMHLAPLERREISPDESEAIDHGKVRGSRWIRIDVAPGKAGVIRRRISRFAGALRLLAGFAAVVAPAAVLTLTALGFVQLSSAIWVAMAALILGALVLLAVAWIWAPGQWSEFLRVRRFISHIASQITVTVVAFFLPGAVTWYLGGFRQPVRNITQFDQVLADPNTAMAIAWLLRWIFISCASVLPALLFFLFDRTQLATLKREFIDDVFRLEPDLETLSDLDAKYGPQIEETYGSSPKRSGRLAAGTRWPIIFATVLLSTGWTALMIHADRGSAMTTIEEGFRFIDFLTPPQSLAGFAFLGAYVFGVRAALRGHLRGDLRAKSYSTMSVRLLIVVVIAWVLEAIVATETTDNGLLQGAAFFAGFFPDEWLRFLNERVNSFVRRLRSGDRQSDVPVNDLNSLAGLDIYDRARLAEEGVDNVQALAKPDLVPLLMHTRIPSARLLDWIDQAVLRLYAGPVCEQEDGTSDLSHRLRELGIRRATQLLVDGQADLIARSDDCPGGAALVRAIRDDPTVAALRHWRCTRLERRSVVTVDAAPDPDRSEASAGWYWRVWRTPVTIAWNGQGSSVGASPGASGRNGHRRTPRPTVRPVPRRRRRTT